jgi:hypothetical protein
MRTIIAGSRGVTDQSIVDKAIADSGFTITAVISGTARGVDRMGEDWARRHRIPIERYPAQWDIDGRSAGYKRNELMGFMADALIAIWDSESRGTKHMINIAQRKGLKIYVRTL